MKRTITLILISIGLAACGSAAADEPTTTVAKAPTTTAAPTTTVAPKQLSREAKVAVIGCLQTFGANPKDFTGYLKLRESISFQSAADHVEESIEACDNARNELLADDPHAGDDASDLAIAAKNLNEVLAEVKVLYLLKEAGATEPINETTMFVTQKLVDLFVTAATKAGVQA